MKFVRKVISNSIRAGICTITDLLCESSKSSVGSWRFVFIRSEQFHPPAARICAHGLHITLIASRPESPLGRKVFTILSSQGRQTRCCFGAKLCADSLFDPSYSKPSRASHPYSSIRRKVWANRTGCSTAYTQRTC